MRTFSWRDFELGGGAPFLAQALATRIDADADRVRRLLELVQPFVEVGNEDGKPFMRIAPQSVQALRVVMETYLPARGGSAQP